MNKKTDENRRFSMQTERAGTYHFHSNRSISLIPLVEFAILAGNVLPGVLLLGYALHRVTVQVRPHE